MLQRPGHIIRITILSIGFVLFVLVSSYSVRNISSRQAVAGKPYLLPVGAGSASQPELFASGSTASMLQVAPISRIVVASAPATATLPATKMHQEPPTSHVAEPATTLNAHAAPEATKHPTGPDQAKARKD